MFTWLSSQENLNSAKVEVTMAGMFGFGHPHIDRVYLLLGTHARSLSAKPQWVLPRHLP